MGGVFFGCIAALDLLLMGLAGNSAAAAFADLSLALRYVTFVGIALVSVICAVFLLSLAWRYSRLNFILSSCAHRPRWVNASLFRARAYFRPSRPSARIACAPPPISALSGRVAPLLRCWTWRIVVCGACSNVEARAEMRSR